MWRGGRPEGAVHHKPGGSARGHLSRPPGGVPPDRCSDVLWGGVSRAPASAAGVRGGVSPRVGAAGTCPRTIRLTSKDGNTRQGAHTPGDGVWVAPPPPAGTHYTHTTHDQGPSASNHIGLHAQSCPQRHAPISSMIVKNRQHQSLFESPDERQKILCAGPRSPSPSTRTPVQKKIIAVVRGSHRPALRLPPALCYPV